MNMSFKEKSTWSSLVATLLIFSNYFYEIFFLIGQAEILAKTAALTLLSKTVILLIIVEVLFQSMLAISNHKAAALGADERDNLFSNKANNIGYSVLVVGVLFTLGQMITLQVNPEWAEHNAILSIPLFTTHILLFSFILSEVLRFSAQLYFYRSEHLHG